MALAKIHKQNLKHILFLSTKQYLQLTAKILKKNQIFFFYFLENYSRRVRKSTNKKILALTYASNFYFLRKRATEEFRKKEDYRHKREVEERLRKNFETSLLGVGSAGPRAQSAPGTSKGKKEAPRK